MWIAFLFLQSFYVLANFIELLKVAGSDDLAEKDENYSSINAFWLIFMLYSTFVGHIDFAIKCKSVFLFIFYAPCRRAHAIKVRITAWAQRASSKNECCGNCCDRHFPFFCCNQSEAKELMGELLPL